jgi:nucleoside-diphosphate-sugar epimerase
LNDTVCVTGASGGIGQALLAQLAGRYRVKALFRARTEVSDRWTERGCVPVWGDVGDEAALAELVKGARLVFHCAALVAQASYQEAYAVNVEGTRRLAGLAGASGCERFVHVSSVAVYGGAASEGDYTEDAPLRERDDMAVYSLTKLQAENALRETAERHRLPYVILRPTSVYGPRTKPHTLIPIEMIRNGVPLVVGDGEGLLDVVYVDDVAKALLLAAESTAASGGTFNLGHETVTFNEFYAHYARMLNRAPRHLPRWVLTGVIRLLESIPGARRTRFREVSRGARLVAAMARNTRRYSSEKARAVLGYAPESSLPVGMLKTELWLKSESRVGETRASLPEYGPLPFRPLALVHPATERELVQVTEVARQHDVKVRTIGSLHSTCAIPYTDGICVVLDRYRALLQADGPLVTVQAGMTIRELNQQLAERGLALPTNGSITAQTVSGAISTATHGGSTFHASLSDAVEALRIVRADGSVADVDRSRDAFPAAAVSLGLLGIISTVTFRCVGAFVLRSRRSVMDAGPVLEEFDRIQRGSLFTCMFYFPVTDQMEILSIDRLENAEPPSAPPTPERPPVSGFRSGFRQRLSGLVLRALAWLLLRHHSIQRFFTRFSVGSAYQPRTDRSDRVLNMTDVGTAGRFPTLLRDMEIAVPYEHAAAAVRVLREHFLATRRFPLMPIHIRCSAPSELWLSPAHERAVCYLEFWQYARGEAHFDRVHALLERFDYRPHWGKETRADPRYVRRRYRRWDDFARLRAEWDPQGMFLNGYLQPFFGES